MKPSDRFDRFFNPPPADAEILANTYDLKLHLFRNEGTLAIDFTLAGSFGCLFDDDDEPDTADTGMDFARKLLAEFSKGRPEQGCCE